MLYRRYATATLRSTKFTAPSGAAERLSMNTQPVGGVTGLVLLTQPIVQANDINGNAVSTGGIVVTAALASGTGSLSGTTAVATSAANGRATFTNLVITGTGTFTIAFTSPGLISVTSATVTVQAANDPTQITMATEPAGATWGVAFTTQPAVQLRDANSSAATVSGITITASIASGSGSLVGTVTASTNASGVATFTNLGIAGSGAHTITFASGALTSATSGSITVAAATKVVMVVQPSGATTGIAFTTQPSVRLQSAASVNVLRSGVSVTVSITSGSGVLSGTTSASTNSSGVATFTDLVITGTGSHTLTFASSGLTSVASSAFTVASAGFTLTDDGNYISTYEPVDSGTVLAEDFSRGHWYTKNCDVANASGGLLQTGVHGWCGTIYADSLLATQPGAVASLGGGNYCGTSGNRSAIGSGMMADHDLKRACTEIWVRYYVKALSGYTFGAEKRVTFNDGVAGGAGIKWGNFSWNCASSANSVGALTMGFPAPGEDVCNYQGLTLSSGTWYCIINRMKLNTLAGTANGEFQTWVDACGTGTTPVNPSGSPTLRFTRTNVNYNRNSSGEQIRVLWFESWANAPSVGECYLGWIHAKDTGSPGFCPLWAP